MMKVRWTAPALRDLESIGDYIARDNPSAAHRLVTRLLRQADTLALNPHLGRSGRVAETRELVVSGTPYIIPYRVHEGRVEILAVFHGARRWPPDFG